MGEPYAPPVSPKTAAQLSSVFYLRLAHATLLFKEDYAIDLETTAFFLSSPQGACGARGTKYYHPHITVEEAEAQRGQGERENPGFCLLILNPVYLQPTLGSGLSLSEPGCGHTVGICYLPRCACGSALGFARDARPALVDPHPPAARAMSRAIYKAVPDTWVFYVIKGIFSRSLSLAVDMVTKSYY